MTVQRAEKCCEAASVAAAKRTPQVTEGILGPPAPGHHRVFFFVSNFQRKYVNEHFTSLVPYLPIINVNRPTLNRR